jgi:hypothetical protein
MSPDPDPLRVTEEEYGSDYRSVFLDMYKDYVASADKMSEHRHAANTFFMTANTALLSVTGYLTGDGAGNLWLPALAGVVFSVTWRVLIGSYRGLNTAKYAVIHDMEQHLPLAPYDSEWAHIKSAGHYLPFSTVESVVPLAFVGLHATVAYLNLFT